ncbi:hypothetical protein PV396_24585 [Streptomyces sp. ME02-8801-2C]|uniref:hypothetical protein n=1 Tax=Streptomyces sp. ME02-8801-2C TaxID=3028680 RepID=UPI00299FBB55|nr:hypothetical protein [Streptomyces sp. ME02-8801-2C]MDX3455080.1 hypothetical protein [Streptomyces sp. ME02-8801-2C]
MSSETVLVTSGGLSFLVTTQTTVPFTSALADSTAPRSADEAAQRLLDDGQHVHLVSEGEAHCPDGRCTPAIVAGLIAGPRPRALPHLSAPSPLT